MKTWHIHGIIHGFALLHAVTVIVCMLLGLQDTLFLTALTMALAVIICYIENVTVEITVVSIILVNLLGFVLGNLGATLVLGQLPDLWKHVLSTTVVTEILGWSLYFFTRRFSPSGAARYERKLSWKKKSWWLAGAILAVLALRTYIGIYYKGNLFEDSGVIGTLIILTILAMGYMVFLATQMQQEASSQRTRRHQAEFRYMNLKHQVDPHFLFNSLNVLDAIVQDGTREECSQYIQKLAGIYRYLMQHEARRLVPLSDELAFARNYLDLIQIRFPEGLILDSRLESSRPHGYIVPCTLQILLENAVKHNSIVPETPLIISVSASEGTLTVRNNRLPKRSVRPSNGIGLQYIRNQYRDIAGAEIQVNETADSFIVTIPILEEKE